MNKETGILHAVARGRGGVRVPHRKNTAEMSVVRMPAPETVVLPMQQHIGAPCTPTVKVGDSVAVGQVIGDSDKFVSAPIHASISGTVTAVGDVRLANGLVTKGVTIKSDGEMRLFDGLTPPAVNSKEELIAAVRASGLVGLGGAGFPCHVKLTVPPDKQVDTLIVNAAECEPYITADYRRMLENPELLVEGMRVILKLFDNAKGLFAIEDNKPDCIAKLKELTKDEPRMEVREMMTKYPQGAERQLIFANTGRAINSTMLPADAGCVVDNVETIISIYNAVVKGIPSMERVVTVTGDGVVNPGNYKVLFGTNQNELIEAAGGLKEGCEKVISGGPMMGFAMYSLNVPVTKNTSSLLAFTHDTVKDKVESPCIRCGRCGEVCPENLLPAKLSTLARRGAMDAFVESFGMECVECGCCSYICPAKRQLTQSIKAMRKMVMAERRKKK